jgi:hypothetical protein
MSKILRIFEETTLKEVTIEILCILVMIAILILIILIPQPVHSEPTAQNGCYYYAQHLLCSIGEGDYTYRGWTLTPVSVRYYYEAMLSGDTLTSFICQPLVSCLIMINDKPRRA